MGVAHRLISANAGYYSAKAVDNLCLLGADPLIAPENTRHRTRPGPEPREPIPKGLLARDRMRPKLRTKRGRQRHALQMETVEPLFGQIKQGRGFRQFLLQYLAKMQWEWSLICRGHNLVICSGMALDVPANWGTGASLHSTRRLPGWTEEIPFGDPRLLPIILGPSWLPQLILPSTTVADNG